MQSLRSLILILAETMDASVATVFKNIYRKYADGVWHNV